MLLLNHTFFKLIFIGMVYFCQSQAHANTTIDTLPLNDNYPLNIDEESHVYLIADKRPEFSGGEEKLGKYVTDHLQYPKQARPHNIKGLVIINFVVCKDGYIRDIKVQKGLGYGCDEEAIRFIASMNRLSNRWIPGKVKGKAVNVRYTLPLKFKIR